MADEDPRAQIYEGEIVDEGGRGSRDERADIATIDVSIIGGLTRAEIDVQIATAHKYRRSITVVQRNVETLATLDVETATSCRFRKPQRERVKDPKTGRFEWKDGHLEGPSIRFAEIVMQSWGNGRVASRVTDQTDTEIEATGVFHDLESNVAWAKSVRVSILTTDGKKFPAHLIATLGNAAAAKAIRNAILAGVPRGVWNKGYQAALKAARGDLATLPDRRKNLFAKAQEDNISQQQIYDMLGLKGEADIGIDQLFDIAQILTAIRDGETTVDEVIALQRPPVDERGLDEAFGKGGAPKGKTPPAQTQAPKEEPKTDQVSRETAPKPSEVAGIPEVARGEPGQAGKAAQTAEPDKTTSGSVTTASITSAAETSGPQAQGDSTSDGRPEDEEVAGKVVEFPGDRQSTTIDATRERKAATPGPDAVTEIDLDAFNAFASLVQGEKAWGPIREAVGDFRASGAFKAAPADVQRQALLLAFNHVEEAQMEVPEADVQHYRLWLLTVVEENRGAVRPAFRKVMRGDEYKGLSDADKDLVVGETNDATGE